MHLVIVLAVYVLVKSISYNTRNYTGRVHQLQLIDSHSNDNLQILQQLNASAVLSLIK